MPSMCVWDILENEEQFGLLRYQMRMIVEQPGRRYLRKMKNTTLLKSFLQHPFRVGSCWPSSLTLCRAMVSGIELKDASLVVELGPGTGVITREVLTQLGSSTRFLAIELDPNLCSNLADNFPSVEFCNESASALGKILTARGLPRADAVISGLPWAIFPEELQREILQSVCDHLMPGGSFVTFAYLQGLMLPAGIRFRKLLMSKFNDVRLSHVIWNNFPPALIYRCKQ